MRKYILLHVEILDKINKTFLSHFSSTLLTTIFIFNFSYLAVSSSEYLHNAEIKNKCIQTRRILIEENADWNFSRVIINSKISLLTNELNLLNEIVSDSKSVLDEDGLYNIELKNKIQAALDTRRAIDNSLSQFEDRILKLNIYFPYPLRKQIEPMFSKFNSQSNDNKLNTNDRLANVLNILNSINSFNNKITVTNEILKMPHGKNALVKTLYVGLAQAYFVDSTLSFAGVGKPAENKWTWDFKNDLAKQIVKAVSIADKTMKPASFVSLPVTITK